MATVSVKTYVNASGVTHSQTAQFGALTIAGAGGWKPKDGSGNVEDITSYLWLVSGSLGSHTPSISSGALVFSPAGCPNGAVLKCVGTSGRVYDVTISSVANSYSARSATEMTAALEIGTLVRGTHSVLLRDQVVINPSGAATGANWSVTAPSGSSGYVTLTGHSNEDRPQIRGFNCVGTGSPIAYHLHFKDIDFVQTVDAGYSGIGPIEAQNACSNIKVTGCLFTSDRTSRDQKTKLKNCISGFDLPVITDNTFSDALYVLWNCSSIDFQRNVVSSFSADALQVDIGGAIIADNFFYGNDPVFNEYTVTDYTKITTGATTTVAIAGHTETLASGAGAIIRSADGAMSAFIGNADIIGVVEGVSITLDIDTTGLDMSGVTEVVIECSAAHVDFVQTLENTLAVSGDPSWGSGYDYQIRRNIIVNAGSVQYSNSSQGLFLAVEQDDLVYPMGLISHNIIVGPDNWGIVGSNDGGNIIIGNVVLSGQAASGTWIQVSKPIGWGGYAVPEESIIAYNIAHVIQQENVSVTEFQNVEPTYAQLSTYLNSPQIWPNVGPTKADVISQFTSIGSALTNLQGAAGIGRVDWDNYTDEIPPLVWASSGVNNAGNLDLSVSTTPDSTGTIYSVITTNASATFTPAEIEAGTDPDVAYATSAADSAGRQTIVYTTPASGTYYAHSVLKRSGSYSPIDVSAGITIA